MAVHFKWGRESSLAWVTSLDSGKPVAGADIRVTDSCTGRQLARGTADKPGRPASQPGLPEPGTWWSSRNDPDPPDTQGHAQMVQIGRAPCRGSGREYG